MKNIFIQHISKYSLRNIDPWHSAAFAISIVKIQLQNNDKIYMSKLNLEFKILFKILVYNTSKVDKPIVKFGLDIY